MMMQVPAVDKEQILIDGFTIIDNVYNGDEINRIINLIDETDQSNILFRNAGGLFAIRQFLIQIPKAKDLIFNNNLKKIIADLFGNIIAKSKSIFFKNEKYKFYDLNPSVLFLFKHLLNTILSLFKYNSNCYICNANC